MKKSITIIMIALLAIALFPSCDSTSQKTGTLRICFGDKNTRTIAPNEVYTDVIDNYSIHLTLPNGETYVAKNITESVLTLKHLPIGQYQLVVLGFKNGQTEHIAKGVASFHLYANDNSISVPMNFLGDGSLTITAKFDKSKLDMKKDNKFLPELFTTNMEPVNIRPSRMKYDAEKNIVFEYDKIPAGTYLLRISIKCDGSLISTHTEAVRIVTTKQTTGVVTLDIGSKVDDLSMNIISFDKNIPLSGKISKTKDINPGLSYEYTASITEKPDYVNPNELTYTWILNGEKAGTDQSIVIERNNAIRDKVFLTVMIGGGIDGIIGSASTVIDFTTTFAESNSNFSKQ